MTHTRNTFSTAELAKITELYYAAEPYRTIGKVVGRSRSAISGKIKRLIDSGEVSVIHTKAPTRGPRGALKAPRALKVKPEPPPPVAFPEPLRLSMMELGQRQCRFQVLDEPRLFCGRPTSAQNHSWCSEHFRAVFQPPKPRSR